MDRIIYGSKMKKVDSYTIDVLGIPSMVLMERAAFFVYTEIEKELKTDKTKKILCLCGMGNNGADGLAIARMLKLKGYEVEAVFAGNEEKATKEWVSQKKIAINCDVTVENISKYVAVGDNNSYNNISTKLNQFDYVIDAIFGIGLTRNVEGIYKELIDAVNESSLKVYAVDIPSGLCADTGKVMGTAIRADKTITFGAMKTGLVLYKGKDFAGKIVVADIGFPDKAYDNAVCKNELCTIIGKEDINGISHRMKHSNKGDYGKVAIIAGSENMYGAAYFTARAACELGAGLVRIITHENNKNLIYEKLPETMISTYKNDADEEYLEGLVENVVSWCDAVVIGPGLSQSREAGVLLANTMKKAFSYNKHIVIDADGLNIIAKNAELKKYYHEKTVITPHIGEASRLMGISSIEIAENIIAVAGKYSRENRINVVQKDSTTVILGIESYNNKCNNRVCINTSGNPGMATGGSGDVLAGMLAAVLAGSVDIEAFIKQQNAFMGNDFLQNNSFMESIYDKTFFGAAIAVYMHGLAGDLAAKERGEASMTATDILNMIHMVLLSC